MISHQLLLDTLNVAIFLVHSDAQQIHYANTAAEILVGTSSNHLKKISLDEILIHANGWQSIFNEMTDDKLLIERSVRLNIPLSQDNLEADIAIKHYHDDLFIIEIQPLNRARAIAKSSEIEAQANHSRLIIKNLAHEIRNPLASMKAATQRLYSIEKEKQSTYLDLIVSQINRLDRLLKQMTGESKTYFSNQNIHQIIEESLLLIKHNPDYQNMIITKQYDPSIPDLPLDSDLIIQVINNLLNNAIKASNYEGTINITTRIEHQYTINHIRHKSVLKLSITDYGCGIPEHLQGAIFQPMISHFKEGSGLGLAIVQNIIQQHHGNISLQSYAGNTTFSIYLPFKRGIS